MPVVQQGGGNATDRKLPATTTAVAKLSLNSPPPTSSFQSLRSPQSSINSNSTGSMATTPTELVLPGRAPILPAAAGAVVATTSTAKSSSNRKRKPMNNTDELVSTLT